MIPILLALLAMPGLAQFTGNAACGECHRNIVRRYAATVMSKEGVLCENCHGAAGMHVKGSGRLEVPTALEGAARDAVCGQCHFTGAARIARAGRDVGRYRAGELLTRYAASFVYAAAPGVGGGKMEELAASRCRQKAGAELWCGTCHDTHTGVTDRAACAGCHRAQQCARGKDCAGCHMPGNDHRILRRKGAGVASGWQLRPFTAADEGVRELGLAYYEVWTKTGDLRQRDEALRLLGGVGRKDMAVRKALAGMQKVGTKKR